MATRKKVWLDCDPGHDDAMAILLASHSDAIDLLGISTVYGNQTVKRTTLNAIKVHYVGNLSKNIQIVEGASKPFVRPERSCPEIHGDSGLDTRTEKWNTILPSAEELLRYADTHKILSSEKAVNHIAREIMSHEKQSVTLLCTAALTNIALLFAIYPEVKEYISSIVSMGGAIGLGNTSPVAEWNIELDPEAAKVVIASGIPFVLVPLNVTHTVLVTAEVVGKIRAMSSPFAELVVDWMHFFRDAYASTFNFEFPPLHDPVAAAYVIDPSLFVTQLMNVEIETSSQLTFGCTVCDIYGTTNRPKNVTVCKQVDVEKFWFLLLGALEKCNTLSPLNQTATI